MFFNTMYNVVDTYFASTISTQALSGMSFSFFIYFIFLCLCFGLNSAITSLIGNSLGSKRKKVAKIYAGNAFTLVSVVAIFSAILGYYTAPYMLDIVGATGEPLAYAIEYINIMFIGTIFMMISFVANAILVSLGDTKSMRNTLILGFFLNIILNPILIYGYGVIPALGFKGIAISTVIIQAINMVYMIYKLSKTELIDFKKLNYFYPKPYIIKSIISQGIPPTLNMLTMSAGQLVIAYFVAIYGYQAIAGYGIGFRIEQIVLLPAFGISNATMSIVSNNYGAKQMDRVKECMKTAVFYGFIISIIGIALIFIFGELIISIFSSEKLIINYAYEYVIIASFSAFSYIVIFICVATLQAIKKPKVIAYIGVYRQLIAPIIVYSLAVHYFEMPIIFLWASLFIITSSAGIFIYFYTRFTISKEISLRVK